MTPECKTPTHSGPHQPFWAPASINSKALKPSLPANWARSRTTPSCSMMVAISGANFHGMPLALALDQLKLSLAAMAGISERRTYWLLSGRDDQSGVPAYLAREAGLESGLMIAQYTAAALVNEIRVACAPASCHNISTSAGIEDFNSFGPTAAFGTQHALDLATKVLAVELLCSADAVGAATSSSFRPGQRRTVCLDT